MDLSVSHKNYKDETLTHSSMEEEESGLDEDDTEVLEACDGGAGVKHQAITGRGITLSMLMQDGLIEPGENCMSIEYLGRKFTGDLLPDGRIFGHKAGELFNSPSAWAISCKKIVNPAKKSGCGWASVKYNGKKLDAFKTSWFHRQQRRDSPVAREASESADEKRDATLEESKMKQEDSDGEGPLNLSMAKPEKKPEFRRGYVKHCSLGRRSTDHDTNTLVECTPFGALGKIQPFTISLNSNSLLLMDFHCHLTTSEVVGYLAGKWDAASQHLSVLQAFPCRCRLGDKENAGAIEDEIRQNIERRGLSLVGWYHSHPRAPPCPSLKDIDAQMDYQLRLKGIGHTYQPCMGLIISPYDKYGGQQESTMHAYWVMPPPENRINEYGMPMSMHYDTIQDIYLSQDVLNELKWLMDFYGKLPDKVKFQEVWKNSQTYRDKIQSSLRRKFPKDQTDGRFRDYINSLLNST